MSREYNARLVDWMCCPDCGCNVIRAEGMTAQGNPTGAIECTCCGFASINCDGDPERVVLDWAKICERAGHEFHPVGYEPNGDMEMICVWCGKKARS